MQSERQSHVNLKLKEVLFYELHNFQLTMIDFFLQKFATEPGCPVHTTVGRGSSFGISLNLNVSNILIGCCIQHRCTRILPQTQKKGNIYF